jgi:RimJ/RimL family protein N-acetyltransferase
MVVAALVVLLVLAAVVAAIWFRHRRARSAARAAALAAGGPGAPHTARVAQDVAQDATPTEIRFRKLERDDLRILRDWLNRPHVYEWWGVQSGPGSLGGSGNNAATLDQVEAKYVSPDPDGTWRYVILTDRPIGVIQWYFLSDSPDYAEQIGELDPGTAGMDIFIGEVDAVNRGVGSRAIDAFVATVVFADPKVTRIVAGPDVRNARSIKAFTKAGFVFARDAEVPGEPAEERILGRDR